MTSLRLALAVGLTLLACGSPSKPADPKPPPPPGPAPSPAPASQKVLVLVDDRGIGLAGYDPVAYAIADAPMAGFSQYTAKHGGATYQFASVDHQATFEADKPKYAPQYGGYCAFAASQNRLSPVDPTVFQIMDGQLLVFTNADFKRQFNEDPVANKRKADANWPGLVEQYGK